VADRAGEFLLEAAVVLNLAAQFRDLPPGHVEGAAPALLFPIQVVQRPVLRTTLAAAARLTADDILFNQ
jgi:hypothetical protein